MARLFETMPTSSSEMNTEVVKRKLLNITSFMSLPPDKAGILSPSGFAVSGKVTPSFKFSFLRERYHGPYIGIFGCRGSRLAVSNSFDGFLIKYEKADKNGTLWVLMVLDPRVVR